MATVLVVEDEPLVQAVANLILENAGHETVCAAGVAEALAVIQSGRRFDLLFTDMRLGADEAGGLRVSHAAYKAWPGIPVIYTTAGRLSEEMARAFVSRHRFLAKPYTARQVFAAVARLIESVSATPI